MRLKAVSGMTLTLLLIGVLTLALNTTVVESPVEHDLVILDVSVSPPNYEGYALCVFFDVNVTVRNNGTVAETFNVTVYYNDTAIETQTVTDMPSYTNLTLTFYWYPSCVPSGTYLISANISSPVLGEIRKDHGYVEFWVWGDIDGDGDVDFFDLGKMILIYSGHILIPEPPELVARWDLDCDDDVDFFDLAKLVLIYSGLFPSCPP